jgi:high-affinity nickel permease
MIFILLTGLGLGLAHSLDPDHVVAVSTLLCNNRSLRKSITSATVWGVGHSAALFIIGLLVLAFSVVIHPTVLKMFDCAAVVLLIILGALVLRPLIHPTKPLINIPTRTRIPIHRHTHIPKTKHTIILTYTSLHSQAHCRDWEAALPLC